MPTIIRIKESNLEIKKTSFFTNISVNTLWVEKGIAVADVIAKFNLAIANEAEARSAAITAEAQLRIDEDLALASYITNLNTQFNTNIASIQTDMSTLSTNIGVVASRTTTLEATTEEHSARLVTSENAMAGYFTVWDGVSPVKVGQLKFVGGVTYQYTGSTWVRYDEAALGVADQVKGWVAGASSLVVDPITKLVTGWQYGDGSGFNSYFKISAENIKLSGSTTFSDFAMKDMSNVTTIDGGKITAGVIYNAGGNAASYTMKIDLDAGEIHIR